MDTHRRMRSGLIALLLILVVTSGAPGDIEIFPIARETKDQQHPAIDGAVVAWQDNRNGDWDIAVAEMSSLSGISPVTYTDMFSESQYPAVSGSLVVWQSKFFMDEDCDIVGLDLSAETFFEVMASYRDECRPAISGDLVVAEVRTTGAADWDIAGADISRRNAPEVFWIDASPADQCRPDVSDGFVVYEDAYDGTWQLYGADLCDRDDPAWFPIFAGAGAQHHPAIAGKWVVWEDDGQGPWAMVGDNIFHPRLPEPLQSSDAFDCLAPDVHNNVVVWQDYRNGNWDIYGYNLTSKTSFQITTNDADQTDPAISFSSDLNGYVVVWQDYRHGNWDIYGAFLDDAEVAGCASPLRCDVNADSVVDANDLDDVEACQGKRDGIPIESE